MAFDNIKLEKGLYTTGKSFTAALEEIDPSENYIGTSLEGLDAYERQLKRFDIKVSGKNSDCVAKFFNTVDASVLFPEYISRAVKTGIEDNGIVDDIVATTTEIDGMDYRSIKTTHTKEELELNTVGEGEMIPELRISLDSNLTKLKKHGKMLVASYEAIKFQKLDLFTTVLKQIGNHIARSEFNQAINSIDGDVELVSTEGENVQYNELVQLWAMLNPYEMNRIIMSPEILSKIMLLPEFSNANSGFDFQSSGKVINILGAKVILTDTYGNSGIIGLDKNYSFEKVQVGGVFTEFDKLIDRQLERAVISTITGFSPIYSDAVKGIAISE